LQVTKPGFIGQLTEHSQKENDAGAFLEGQMKTILIVKAVFLRVEA